MATEHQTYRGEILLGKEPQAEKLRLNLRERKIARAAKKIGYEEGQEDCQTTHDQIYRQGFQEGLEMGRQQAFRALVDSVRRSLPWARPQSPRSFDDLSLTS